MPSQIPPTRSISGDVSRTTIMSSPGAMPSVMVPRTVPVKVSGVVPDETVRPSTACPSVRSPTGTVSGHWASAVGGTAEAVATGASPAPPASAITPISAASGRRRRRVITVSFVSGRRVTPERAARSAPPDDE
jgi:hypothetical protein